MAAVIAFFFPQKELFSILILLNPLLKSAMRMEVIFVNYKVLSNKSTAALKKKKTNLHCPGEIDAVVWRVETYSFQSLFFLYNQFQKYLLPYNPHAREGSW